MLVGNYSKLNNNNTTTTDREVTEQATATTAQDQEEEGSGIHSDGIIIILRDMNPERHFGLVVLLPPLFPNECVYYMHTQFGIIIIIVISTLLSGIQCLVHVT